MIYFYQTSLSNWAGFFICRAAILMNTSIQTIQLVHYKMRKVLYIDKKAPKLCNFIVFYLGLIDVLHL